MQFARCAVLALCLFASADCLKVQRAGRAALRRAAAERVQLIAQSKLAVESILSLPANVTNVSKQHEAKVLTALEAQVKSLQDNVAKISAMDKGEHTKEAEAKNKDLRSHMKGADQAMLDKMDDWGKRMNRKTRLGAMDVLSKLKNAIHLVKKGALSGNKDASDSLNDVLSKMGQMAGQPAAGQKFLH